MNSYTDGALVVITANFSGPAGAANPTTTTLKIRVGNGATQTFVFGSSSMTNPATGAFAFEFDTTGLAAAGTVIVTYEWIGTGAVQAEPTSAIFEVVPRAL